MLSYKSLLSCNELAGLSHPKSNYDSFFWKDSLYLSKSGSFIHFHSFRIRTRANFPRLTIKINSGMWQKKWVWIWEFNLFIICKTISYWKKKKWLLILLVENQFDLQFFKRINASFTDSYAHRRSYL